MNAPILKVLNHRGSYQNKDAPEKLQNYMCNPDKTPSNFVGCAGFSPDVNVGPAVVVEMNDVVQQSHKDFGVMAWHLIVSYHPRETTDPAVVNAIASEVASYIGQRFQTVYAVHEDTDNLHFHIMFNAVSYVDGKKYKGTRRDHYAMMDCIKAANHKFGIYGLRYVSNKSDEDIQ